MPHLITAKTITSFEPKPIGEVGGGCPLQLGRWTYFAKIKSKIIIAEKSQKFNKKSTLRLVGQSWSNFMCIINGVGERLH